VRAVKGGPGRPAGRDQCRAPVVIYADRREEGSGIPAGLRSLGAVVEVRDLPVGDYLLSARVAVERKTTADFLASALRKRLWRQLQNLAAGFSHAVMIVEGHDLFQVRKEHPEIIRHTLAAIVLDYRLPVLFTRNPEETAALLLTVAKREQLGFRTPVGLRGERQPRAMEERQRYVVESLPQVGPVLAERLLRHFGSIEALVRASEEELMAVPAIGRVRARQIAALFRNRFEGDGTECRDKS